MSYKRSATDHDFSLDTTKEKKYETLENIPNRFDCNCGTPSYGSVSQGTGRSRELPSRGQKHCHCSRCVGRWIKLVQSNPTASSQGIACGCRAEPIDLAG